MARKSLMKRNEKRQKMYKKYEPKRQALKKAMKKQDLPLSEIMALVWKLAKLPRNSSKVRIRNRCSITGRPRGYYRRFGICRNLLRDFAGHGVVSGLVKSSW